MVVLKLFSSVFCLFVCFYYYNRNNFFFTVTSTITTVCVCLGLCVYMFMCYRPSEFSLEIALIKLPTGTSPSVFHMDIFDAIPLYIPVSTLIIK